ncbi:hypothetical protein AVEN_116729-1, partial [Araneus ventricosus]
MAITSHGPTPPVGGTYYHWIGKPNHHHHYTRRSENPLTYPEASHPLARGAP